MPSPTTLNNIFTRYKKEAGDSRIAKIDLIKDLNDLLLEMEVTKPAEQQVNFYYLNDRDFIKYPIPDDFRDPIALYSDSLRMIRYVSNLKFNLGDPISAYTDVSDAGIRYLKARSFLTNANTIIASACNSLTEDGSWVNSGNAGVPSIDESVRKYGSGSIKFAITGTQGIITFIKTNAIDASDFTEQMRERFFTWLPVAPTNIKIRVGNDSSNFFEVTVTKQVSNEIFDTDDYNEIEFSEKASEETGTVDKTNIVWFQFEYNFGSNPNNSNFRIDKIIIGKPEILKQEYYTRYVAIDANGNLIEKISEDEDTTDEPIIKNYSPYINTIVDGLVANHLKNKAPERAARFREDYMGKKSKSTGKLIGGLAYLARKYPSRVAAYKRTKSLPPLNRGRRRGIYR